MTLYEELCTRLNVPLGSKYEGAVCNMVNELIFDEKRTYSDEEITALVTSKFKKLFHYL